MFQILIFSLFSLAKSQDTSDSTVGGEVIDSNPVNQPETTTLANSEKSKQFQLGLLWSVVVLI